MKSKVLKIVSVELNDILFPSLRNSVCYCVELFWPSFFCRLESIWTILQLSLKYQKNINYFTKFMIYTVKSFCYSTENSSYINFLFNGF
jgi:hypothetical protein